MAEEEKLKLGKGAAFVKGRLKRLDRCDETWEADFQALPKPPIQSETHYLGMVVTKTGGALLADLPVRGRPSVNDLATLLAHAMRRPLDGHARRPSFVRVRGHHQWRELFPHLAELGVEVSVERKMPATEKAYRACLRRLRDEHRAGMTRPTADQGQVEAMFPAIARYVRGGGHIEIGDQESFGFEVRATARLGLQWGAICDFDPDMPVPGSGTYASLLFHRNAIALVSRALAPPLDTGVPTSYVSYKGIPIRVMVQWNNNKRADEIVFDSMFGAAVVREDHGAFLLSA